MSEKQARKQLKKLLRHFTAGSILHLLADIYGEHAEAARQQGNAAAFETCRLVQHSLVVLGMGVDAAVPS